jgi:hypothetical protein
MRFGSTSFVAALVASTLCVAVPAFSSPRVRAVVEIEPSQTKSRAEAARSAAPLLYLNRCSGGCDIYGGATNDASAHQTSIPPPGTYRVGEFQNGLGDSGVAADFAWSQVVKCVKEVYSPFAIAVSDVRPEGQAYNEAIIAGRPGDIARPIDNLGVAPIASDCSPQSNVLSFTFANHHGGSLAARERDICWTAAQESAHAYGLDHEFAFTDGTSACRDVMTYREDCGGQRFFRDQHARCGETTARACRCSPTQNSHRLLLATFGAGTPITTPPQVAISSPAGGSFTDGATVYATAGAQRGVATVELFLNGSRWSVVPGAAFGRDGQGDPETHRSEYALSLPATVPDGVIDIEVVASDDLGISASSIPVTVTKGQPCADASQCAFEQKCEAGRCFWDPPTAQLGDACSYDQACKSWDCADTGDGKRCVTACQINEPATCPQGFVCSDVGGGRNICLSSDSGGCCSAAQGGARGPLFLGVAVLAWLLRPRNRSSRREAFALGC